MTDDVVTTMLAKQPELDDPAKEFLTKVLGHYELVALQMPEKAETRDLRAQGHFKVAYLRELLGKSAEAITGYREATLLLQELADDFPTETVYRHKLARACDNLGVLLAEAGHDKDAETTFRRGIALLTDLTVKVPKNNGYRAELAKHYNDLATLLDRREDHREATRVYRVAVDRLEKLVADAAEVDSYQQDLARVRSNLAQCLRKQEQLAEADALYAQAVRVQERQLQKHPEIQLLRSHTAGSYHGWGINHAEAGRMDKAEEAFARAIEQRKKLHSDFPRVVRCIGASWRDCTATSATCCSCRRNPRPRKTPSGRPSTSRRSWSPSLSVVAHRQDAANTYSNLAMLYQRRNEVAAAVPLLEKARTHLLAALENQRGQSRRPAALSPKCGGPGEGLRDARRPRPARRDRGRYRPLRLQARR